MMMWSNHMTFRQVWPALRMPVAIPLFTFERKPMDLIQSLREKLGARQRTAAETYWASLRKAATKPTERTADEVEAAASALGKSPEQVEGDLELLGELQRAEQALAAARQQAGRIGELRESIAADLATANEAFQTAEAASKRARDNQSMLSSLGSSVDRMQGEVSRCKTLLERRGDPLAAK